MSNHKSVTKAHQPPTAWMREASITMRVIASTVLVTFTMLILQPAAMAAQAAAVQPAHKASHVQSDEEKLSEVMQRLDTKLAGMDDKLGKGQDTASDQAELVTMKNEVTQLDHAVMANFQAIEDHIVSHQLPDVILQRHKDTVAKYQTELTTLRGNLEAIDKAATPEERRLMVQSAKAHLKSAQHQRTPQSFDPKQLPFSVPDGKVRAPFEKKADFQALLFEPKPVQVAAVSLPPGLLAADGTTPLPRAEDMQATEDVQITPDIQALAASLNNDPVKIYNWVHNNIEFLPTYGSIQGSQMTFDNKKGNAFDTASLLIALLRAAQIPARYGYGTVQLPIDKVMNWVGGVTVPEAALQVLAQGGIPNTGLVQGGVIKYVKMEHVWVEAWVDYQPSRGAKNIQGDSWVPMDASFKQYTYTQGTDLQTAVPFDAQALVDQVTQSAQINNTEGWVSGVNESLVQTALTNYQTQVQDYLTTNNPNATVGDILGTKTIAQSNAPTLALGLPYQMIIQASSLGALPASVKVKLHIKFYANQIDQAIDLPTFDYAQSLPQLAGKRITFAYEPSTEADKAVLDDALINYQTNFPAYLVNMTPTLKIEGEAVANGGTWQIGTAQELSVEISTPWYTQTRNYQLLSGDYFVLGLDHAGVSPSLFDKRTTTNDLSTGSHPNFTAEMFNQVMLGYWAELDAYSETMAKVDDVIHYRLPSHGMAGAPISVGYLFGIPNRANYKSRMLDVKESRMLAVHEGNASDILRSYVGKTGYMSSALESAIYEQAFLMKPGYSMSAATALRKAAQSGVPIYHITKDNVSTALTALTVGQDVVAAISSAVNAGMEVTVPRDNVTSESFIGTGYVIIDPQTGSGSYLISGGRNGNDSPSIAGVYPMPQVPSVGLIGIMTRSALRSASAGLVAESGLLSGVAIGVGASAAAVVAAIVVVLMVVTVFVEEINRRYPETLNLKLRHYTDGKGLIGIVTSKVIWQTENGSFGDGVYFADALDEENRRIGCPPNSLEVATRLEIDEPGNIKPEKATAWIEITITRANYYEIESGNNNSGGTEIVIKDPLLPYPAPFGYVRALYIGPWAFGIVQEGSCL